MAAFFGCRRRRHRRRAMRSCFRVPWRPAHVSCARHGPAMPPTPLPPLLSASWPGGGSTSQSTAFRRLPALSVCLPTLHHSCLFPPLSALSTATATTNARGGGRLVKLTAGPGPGPFEAHQPVSVFPFQPSAQTHADAGPRGHQQLCTIPFLSRRWNVSASVPLRGRSEFVEKVSGHYPSTAAFLLQLGFPTPRRAAFCCPSTPSSSMAAYYPCQPRRPYERAAQRRAGGRAHTLPSVSPPLCVLLRCGLTLRSRGPARRSSRLVQLIRCTACGLDPVGPSSMRVGHSLNPPAARRGKS